jgi:hypothetical protein
MFGNTAHELWLLHMRPGSEFSNIDLYQVAIYAKSMIPSSATNMCVHQGSHYSQIQRIPTRLWCRTLRDCNISSFGYDFATGLGSLKAV